MSLDHLDLEGYLERTADQVDARPVPPGEDLRRGARALRRRRAAGTGAALGVVTLAGLSVALLRPDTTPTTVPVPVPPAASGSTPAQPRAAGTALAENASAEEVMSETLDPRGRFTSYSTGAASGEYGQDRTLDAIRPRILWQGPGMSEPATVELVLSRAGAADGWQCSASCGSYRLDGAQVLTGVTDGGQSTWRYEQVDGEVVQVLLYDFPDDSGLPARRLDDLLTSPDLNLPEVSLPNAVRLHRDLDAAAAGVLLDHGWNFRVGADVESSPSIDAVVMQDGQDRGLAHWEITAADGDLTRCPGDLRDCRVVETGGRQVRIGVETTGDRKGWLRVEADHGQLRVQSSSEPVEGGWALSEELARLLVTDPVFD